MDKCRTPAGIRILSLGDSYTIGTGVEARDRWPSQLAVALRKDGYDTFEPVYIAQNGWTTADLLEAISFVEAAGEFDLVSLLIGVNNQYQGLDINRYTREFESLLQRAIHYAGGNPCRVIVLSIPDWSVTPFADSRNREKIAREIDLYNVVNRQLLAPAGACYVDITSLTRLSGGFPDSLAEDGLHPSPRMYAAWVELGFAADETELLREAAGKFPQGPPIVQLYSGMGNFLAAAAEEGREALGVEEDPRLVKMGQDRGLKVVQTFSTPPHKVSQSTVD